jgi:hypothetical protein
VGDINSMYPAAQNAEYPSGKSLVIKGHPEKAEKAYMDGLKGVYKVRATPPPGLQVSCVPFRNPRGQDDWTVCETPGFQSYVDTDIRIMKRAGYDVQWKGDAWVKNSKKRVFSAFVERFSKLKDAQVKPSALYSFYKTLLACNWSKPMQKVGNDVAKIVDTVEEFNDFADAHNITSCDRIDRSYMLRGEPIDAKKLKKSNKHFHLPPHVTAETRRMLFDMFEVISPDLTELQEFIAYIGVDALHLTAASWDKLLAAGLAKPVADCILGLMRNEQDKDGVVYKAHWAGYNRYWLKIIHSDGTLSEVKKGAGFNNKDLTIEMFEDGEKHKIVKPALVVVPKEERMTKKQRAAGLEPGDVIEAEWTSTFHVKDKVKPKTFE